MILLKQKKNHFGARDIGKEGSLTIGGVTCREQNKTFTPWWHSHSFVMIFLYIKGTLPLHMLCTPFILW